MAILSLFFVSFSGTSNQPSLPIDYNFSSSSHNIIFTTSTKLFRNPITSDGPTQQPQGFHILSKLAVLENDVEMKYLLEPMTVPRGTWNTAGLAIRRLSPSTGKPGKKAIRQSSPLSVSPLPNPLGRRGMTRSITFNPLGHRILSLNKNLMKKTHYRKQIKYH